MKHENELLALIDDLAAFEKTYGLTNGFNLFHAVGMVRQEIRHSRFLAFLLDPAQTHGLGDRFLKAILLHALAARPGFPVSRLTASIADCADALVYCERDHFDITVEIPELKLILVIENKVDATEREMQLADYRLRTTSRYAHYEFLGIFLTPDGYLGDDEAWISLSYHTVVEKIRALMAETALAPAVVLAITHYIELVEKEIIVSQDLINACRKIYARHRQAIDLLVEHGKVPVMDEAFALFSANKPGLQLYRSRTADSFFVAAAWLSIAGFQVADKSWGTSCPVNFWFNMKDSKLYLRIEVGPLQEGSTFNRSGFVDGLRKRFDVKKTAAAKESFTRIKTIHKAINDDQDVHETCAAMQSLWDTMGGTGAIALIEEEARHWTGA